MLDFNINKIDLFNGGEGGIRTLGTLARSTVFETAPFDHSGTSPTGKKQWGFLKNAADHTR